jgi:hypothetical protein
MKLSHHARKRAQQRGIPETLLSIVLQYGQCENAPGGVVKCTLRKRDFQNAESDLKRMIQDLDKMRGVSAIMGDNVVITVMK